MIHGSSTDPVFIKKIYLKIWSLRDELEAVLIKKTEQKGSELSKEEKDSLAEEYRYKGPPLKSPKLALIEGGADAAEEESSDEETQENEDNTEEGASLDGDNSEVEIIQRSSKHIPEERLSKGMTVLSEIGMNHLYFFSSKSFLEGQSIVVEFQVPKKFVVNVDVSYCRPFNIKSRIISENKLSYRIAGVFTFLKPGERTLLRQFINSIEPEVKEEVVIKKQASSDDGDGDFGDLDDLI